jgi:hypothetical protein
LRLKKRFKKMYRFLRLCVYLNVSGKRRERSTEREKFERVATTMSRAANVIEFRAIGMKARGRALNCRKKSNGRSSYLLKTGKTCEAVSEGENDNFMVCEKDADFKLKREMKRVVLMIIPALICGVMFTNCNSNTAKQEDEKTTDEPTVLQYVKTELGGCNLISALKSDDSKTKDDTVLITVSDESVQVFVGHNYICKEIPFETQCELIDDVMCMSIIDTGGDYFRCMCYYTFDFIFQREGAISQKYKILLIDPRKENPIVISEGTIAEKE